MKTINIIKYIFSITFALSILLWIEWIWVKDAFDFDTYTAVSWIGQMLGILCASSIGVMCCYHEIND